MQLFGSQLSKTDPRSDEKYNFCVYGISKMLEIMSIRQYISRHLDGKSIASVIDVNGRPTRSRLYKCRTLSINVFDQWNYSIVNFIFFEWWECETIVHIFFAVWTSRLCWIVQFTTDTYTDTKNWLWLMVH